MDVVVFYGADHELAGQVKQTAVYESPPAKPVIFDSADWKSFAYAILGAVALPESEDEEEIEAAGMERYGAIIKAARASTTNLTVTAVDQYDTEKFFRKDKVIKFLGALNADGGIVTGPELAAFDAGWLEK